LLNTHQRRNKMIRSCETCEFWIARQNCHLNPPDRAEGKLDSKYPITQARDWCGGWVPAPKPKKEDQ